MPSWLMPAVGMAINIASASTYVFYGDWRRAVYWACCALLTAVMTF
jgi:hypothetical protein